MNTPKRPEEPPPEGASVENNPAGTSPRGIPDGMEDHEPKGHPSSDRHQTETASSKSD